MVTAAGAVHGQSQVERNVLLGGPGGLGVDVGGGLVAALREKGAKVEALGRAGSLEGWLVVPAGERPYTLYVDETGHAVMGLLFSPEGRALSGSQVDAVRDQAKGAARPEPVVRTRVRTREPWREAVGAARPGGDLPGMLAGKTAGAGDGRQENAPAVSERVLRGVFEAALAVEGFVLGKGGPEVVVFADPTCVPSRVAVVELSRSALKGAIRLRVLPVGARGAEAEAMAAMVLGSEDRARAWFRLDRNGEWPAVGAEAAAGVALNRRLFDRTGSDFVPFALFREENGRVRSAVGLDFRRWFGNGTAR